MSILFFYILTIIYLAYLYIWLPNYSCIKKIYISYIIYRFYRHYYSRIICGKYFSFVYLSIILYTRILLRILCIRSNAIIYFNPSISSLYRDRLLTSLRKIYCSSIRIIVNKCYLFICTFAGH